MANINERTTIPIIWAASLLSLVLVPTAIGAMWVKGVNDRLSRIESRLGIQPEVASGPAVIENAEAKDAGK